MSIDIRGLCPLLGVFDMPTSLSFYRDTLGFEIIAGSPAGERSAGDHYEWVLLNRNGTELMLNTAYDPDEVRPDHADPARVKFHDDTTLYMGCPDVDAAYVYLRSRGLSIDPPVVTHYRMKQLHLKDPDGFGVCFQWAAGDSA